MLTLRWTGLLAAIVLIGAACGETVTQSTGGSDGTGGSGASSGSASANGGTANGGAGVGGAGVGGSDSGPSAGGAGPHPCQEGCQAFWDCTQLDNDGEPICPGLQGQAAAEQLVIEGCLDSPQCQFVGQIVGDGTDPATCASGLDLIASMTQQFADACSGGG